MEMQENLEMQEPEKLVEAKWEIIQKLEIGCKQYVIGQNKDINLGIDEKFMCAELIDLTMFGVLKYVDVVVTKDYPYVVKDFTGRVMKQAEIAIAELEKMPKDNPTLTARDCVYCDRGQDINGKIIVINPKVMKSEYQQATNQLCLVTGGFGANANSMGKAVFTTRLFDGKQSRWDRSDILGIVKKEVLPKWAKAKIDTLQKPKEPQGMEMDL